MTGCEHAVVCVRELVEQVSLMLLAFCAPAKGQPSEGVVHGRLSGGVSHGSISNGSISNGSISGQRARNTTADGGQGSGCISH